MTKVGQIKEPDRFFYTLEDFSQGLGQSIASTKVFLNRRIRAGELLRVRRNLYLYPEDFSQLNREDLFCLANLIQTPSYLSYLTALAYFDWTTQIPVSVIESTNPIRTCHYEFQGITFRYLNCRPAYYFGYTKVKNFFIAEPEKALLDSLYLSSLGRYALDVAALDLKNIKWKTLMRWSKKYPKRFQSFLTHWRKEYERA